MEQEKTFKGRFGVDFQETILKLMLTDENFAIKCCKWVKPSYFETKFLSWVFTSIQKYHDEFHKLPSLSTLENEARKYKTEEQPGYFDVIKRIVMAGSLDDDYIRKHLTGFIRVNIFIDTYTVAANIYNNQNPVDAPDYMIQKMAELQQVDLDDDKLTEFNNMEQYLKQAQADAENAIPTGITAFDKYMMGGMSKGSLTVLIGATGVGKSIYLINIAVNAMLHSKKVLFIYHEDEESNVRLRFVSRLTKIPFNKLFCPTALTDEEWGKVHATETFLKEMLMLKSFWGTHIYVENVMEWAKMKKKEWDYDLLVDDYIQFINSKDRKMFKNTYDEQVHMHVYFKQTALELQVAALTVAQGNREAIRISAKGSGLIRSSDIAECIGIAHKATNVITVNRSYDNIKNNTVVFLLEKNKWGTANKAVLCESDFNRICTHELNKQYELEVDNNGINSDISKNIISGVNKANE